MGGIFGGSGTSINTTEPMALGVRIQTSAYGLPIPIVYGRTRIQGNLIWYSDFTAIPHTTTSSSGGGKGGGGDVTSSNTTYTYTAAFAMGLCEGTITDISAFWADKDYYTSAIHDIVVDSDAVKVSEIYYIPSNRIITVKNSAHFKNNVSVVAYGLTTYNTSLYSVSASGVYTFATSVTVGAKITITYYYYPHVTQAAKFKGFMGTYPQATWTFLTDKHPDSAIAYEGLAYVAASAYDLGSSSSMQNHTFDVTGRLPFSVGTIDDANPKDIVMDFLTNSHYGAGFPSSKLGSYTQYSNYCVANGLFLSPAYQDQKPANETLTDLCKFTNSGIYFSEGLLKIVPFGDTAATANGVTYTPNVTPIYALTDDDFISRSGDDPVRLLRNAASDAFNSVQVEFLNRENEYNIEIAEAKDQVNIDSLGLRPMEPVTAHDIADPSVARNVAQLILQRSCYIRNTYEFNLSWKYCLLEPTDYVTLTEATLGLVDYPVRILSIEENDDGLLSVVAEDAPAGVSSNELYEQQSGAGSTNYNNIVAGDTNAPVVFEAPAVLTATGLEVWIGACGGENWGGCQVWVSVDGVNYQQVGVISNPARMGWLTSALPSHADPDTTDTLAVNLSISKATLDGASTSDADKFATLSYVDGEFISYAGAALTAANQYNLTYLRRGVYNSTIGAHAINSSFIRCDSAALFKYPFTSDKIGTTLYVKLPSFNVYGSGVQSIADVTETVYVIKGTALTSPLPNVTKISTNFIGGILNIYWAPVVDFRQPSVDYEIRFGDSWESGKVMTRTPMTQYAAPTNGSYWISAHYLVTGGANVYSSAPVEVIVSGAALVRNVVATYDEKATSWSGTKTNLTVVGTDLVCDPNENGTYTLPSGHSVDIGRVAPCVVQMNYNTRGQSTNDNVLALADVLGVTDLLGAALGAYVDVIPQIATADASGVYGAWVDFIAGVYNAQYFKSRVLVQSNDNQVIAVLSEFVFSVDVPDRIDSYAITTLTSGDITVSYSSTFNGGNGASSIPTVQATIINASAGDIAVISAQTKSNCKVSVYNGGSRVARTVNVQVQGY